VLSTEIFFSVVGAQLDQGRAASLGWILLLLFALTRSSRSARVLGRKVFTSLVRQGRLRPADAAAHRRAAAVLYGIALPWATLTARHLR
jgi:iron(III) transport system permease protein